MIGPEFAAALVEALKDLTTIEATERATIEGKDGKAGFSYTYADLAGLVDVTRPALAAHGIVALTPVSSAGVSVILLHISGETLDFPPLPLPLGSDPRANGSSITYHRRYALLAALNIAVGAEDDDGAAASQPRETSDTVKRAGAPDLGPLAREWGAKHAGEVAVLLARMDSWPDEHRVEWKRAFVQAWGDPTRLPPDDLAGAQSWVVDQDAGVGG